MSSKNIMLAYSALGAIIIAVLLMGSLPHTTLMKYSMYSCLRSMGWLFILACDKLNIYG
jgi:hypothetical protein